MGSGKTTLARSIRERTGIPWHSADDELGWLPGWVERPTEEQREMAARLTSGDASSTPRAAGGGTWCWRGSTWSSPLDHPGWLSLGQLLRRAPSRDSIVAWHFRTFPEERALIDEWVADPTGPPVLRLRSPAETERWLGTLGPVTDG